MAEVSARSLLPTSSRFTAYEMTQYILKALALEDGMKTTNGNTFKMHGYGGTLNDLFYLIDELAVNEGKIKKIVGIPQMAWAANGERHIPAKNTNLNYPEINLFSERVHYLLNQMVLGPGDASDVSTDLPWIHVTEYGKKCIASRDILPYDSDGYINRIISCNQHDDWDVYYIQQSLMCFNHGLWDASTMMLGIEGEYLAERLIESFGSFLSRNDPAEKQNYESRLKACGFSISSKYTEYHTFLGQIENKKDAATGNLLYPDLNTLSKQMDRSAHYAFMNYLRLTRNSLMHPSSTIMEPSETMLLIVSFLKYFEKQNLYLEYYSTH